MTLRFLVLLAAYLSLLLALAVLFAMPLSYATHRLSGANLGVFVPMLEETSVVARFLGARGFGAVAEPSSLGLSRISLKVSTSVRQFTL